MRKKPLILLLVSLGCGLIASFAVSQVLSERRDGEEQLTAPILIAAKDISPMTKMTADMVRVEEWPVDRVPSGSVADTKEIETKYAKQRMYVGEPIIDAKLSARGKDLVVPIGYRIFDVRVDDSNGGSGYISPGDRVDVTGFFEGGSRFPLSKSIRVLRNVEVAMVDGISFRDPEAAPKKAGTIQLLVLDKQYEVLDTASNLGKLKLSLRAPDGDERAASVENTDTGDSFLSWLKESEKKKEVSEVASSAVSSLSLLQGMFASMKPKPKPEERKEMMVLTPGSVSIYRWVNGRKMPIQVSPDEYYSANAAQGYANPNGFGEYQNADASQSNMTWDPNTGTWQSGGFTPVYP